MHDRVIEKIAEAFVRNNIPAPRWDSKRIKALLRYLARIDKAVDQYFGRIIDPSHRVEVDPIQRYFGRIIDPSHRVEVDPIQRVHIRITAEMMKRDGAFEQTESVAWTTSGPHSVADPLVASRDMRMRIQRATLVRVQITSPYDLYRPRVKNLSFRFKMGG